MKIKRGLFGFGRRVDTDTANVMQNYGNEKLKTLLSLVTSNSVLHGLDVSLDLANSKIIISKGAYIYANEIFKVDDDIVLDLPELEEGETYYFHIKPKIVQEGFWSNRYGSGYLWEVEDNEVKISKNDYEAGYIKFYSIKLEDSELGVYTLREEKGAVQLIDGAPKFSNLDADTIDGLHAEDLSGSKILAVGVCHSGEIIQSPSEKSSILISPIIKRSDYKVLSKPTITSITGGITQTYPFYNFYYTVVARDEYGRYSEPSLIRTYTKAPHPDANVTISWSSVSGATDYVLFGYREGDQGWRIISETTNTSASFGSLSGEIGNPFISPARFISVSAKKYSNLFQPFIELYSFETSQTVNINYSLTQPNTSYTWSMLTGTSSNYLIARTNVYYKVWRRAWSGSCTVTIRWKIGIKLYDETEWEERVYTSSWYVENIWFTDGYAEGSLDYTEIFRDLDIGRYQVRWTFIDATLSNGNYVWVSRIVTALNVTYYTATKIDELTGVYIIYEDKER